jgi:hypothetical protein
MENNPPWELTEEIRKMLENENPDWDTQEQPTWETEYPQPEYISLAPVILDALTKKQRQAILERDDYTSQMRHYSEDEGWHHGGYCEDGGKECTDLHVHHIIPQREGGLDEPENLITLFACEHIGVCKQQKIKREVAKK